jgi:hypothetical protein
MEKQENCSETPVFEQFRLKTTKSGRAKGD